MILDVIVGSSGKVLGNFRPTIAVDLVQLQNFPVFLESPLHLFYFWVEVIVPSECKHKEKIE